MCIRCQRELAALPLTCGCTGNKIIASQCMPAQCVGGLLADARLKLAMDYAANLQD